MGILRGIAAYATFGFSEQILGIREQNRISAREWEQMTAGDAELMRHIGRAGLAAPHPDATLRAIALGMEIRRTHE